MKKNPFLDDAPPSAPPSASKPSSVRVIEAIPVEETGGLPADYVAAEKVPQPANLVVRREIGRGGMGHVHPAADRNMLRQVALKRLDKAFAEKAFYRDAFVAEAQITGQLEHPNIVPVHELAIAPDGVPYFTMKLVQGSAFDEWLRARPPGTIERIEGGIEILIKVCDALAYAHHRGVIHRDLKPENIMVGDFGQVYLMDWGLGKLRHGEPASGPGAMMMQAGPVGTPHFMAPEQARGNPEDVDERSDIFGIGAILFEVLSGQSPYGRAPMHEILKRAQAGAVQPIDAACKHVAVSRRIRAVAEKATSPDKTQRYATVVELQEAMRAFLHGGLHMPQKKFAPGELIVREGEKGDAAYMIVAGKCRAYRTVGGAEETLQNMEPGDVFGEMALILYEPRAASVVAVDEVTVLVLDQATMNEGLGLSGWTGALVRALAQRFADLENVVRAAGIRRG